MLTFIACALLAGGVVIGARWWFNRVDAIGRRVPLPWSAWMLPIAGVIALIPVIRHHNEEVKLSQVATVLADAKATVHCQSGAAEWVDSGIELGYVKWGPDGTPEHSTLIKHAQCGLIAAYLRGGRAHPSQDEIIAVHVLTHESMHMSGIKDEALAECAAVQRDAHTARLLGATPAQADFLSQAYWHTVYPQMPDPYTTPDCKAGGRLDEHLGDGPW